MTGMLAVIIFVAAVALIFDLVAVAVAVLVVSI
jgi:hypothetical protein